MNLQAHYIRLYRKADEILRQPDNPCEIQTVNGRVTCRKSREGNGGIHSPQLCCEGCRHLGPEGCTVMALGCKLGWCWCNQASIIGMKLHDHPTFEKIAEIRSEARHLGVPMPFRNSFSETFGCNT